MSTDGNFGEEVESIGLAAELIEAVVVSFGLAVESSDSAVESSGVVVDCFDLAGETSLTTLVASLVTFSTSHVSQCLFLFP